MKSMRALGKILLRCALPVMLASCAHVGNPHLQARSAHPLIGKIWDVAAQRFVDPAVVLERAEHARFVLLGEIHDNADHHRIQARILETVVTKGRRPALVMEQYDIDQQGKIDAILQGSAPEDDKVLGLAALMRKTWDWPAYEPMARLALQRNLPVIAANMSRDALRQVGRNGWSVLGEGAEERLALRSVWTPARQKQLVQDIDGGHCGKIPEHVIELIAKSQRARDAAMADTILKFKETGAVVIMGRGHARQDMAVPLYLAARAPDATVLSLGLVEVASPNDPAAYSAGALGQHYDYVWFTLRPERKSNPCDSIPAPSKPAGAV